MFLSTLSSESKPSPSVFEAYDCFDARGLTREEFRICLEHAPSDELLLLLDAADANSDYPPRPIKKAKTTNVQPAHAGLPAGVTGDDDLDQRLALSVARGQVHYFLRQRSLKEPSELAAVSKPSEVITQTRPGQPSSGATAARSQPSPPKRLTRKRWKQLSKLASSFSRFGNTIRNALAQIEDQGDCDLVRLLESYFNKPGEPETLSEDQRELCPRCRRGQARTAEATHCGADGDGGRGPDDGPKDEGRSACKSRKRKRPISNQAACLLGEPEHTCRDLNVTRVHEESRQSLRDVTTSEELRQPYTSWRDTRMEGHSSCGTDSSSKAWQAPKSPDPDYRMRKRLAKQEKRRKRLREKIARRKSERRLLLPSPNASPPGNAKQTDLGASGEPGPTPIRIEAVTVPERCSGRLDQPPTIGRAREETSVQPRHNVRDGEGCPMKVSQEQQPCGPPRQRAQDYTHQDIRNGGSPPDASGSSDGPDDSVPASARFAAAEHLTAEAQGSSDDEGEVASKKDSGTVSRGAEETRLTLRVPANTSIASQQQHHSGQGGHWSVATTSLDGLQLPEVPDGRFVELQDGSASTDQGTVQGATQDSSPAPDGELPIAEPQGLAGASQTPEGALATPSRLKRAFASPYFKSTTPSTTKGRRSSGQSASCIPFPPLGASCFGLIQEVLAHVPFQLLIAVAFLNRTRGIDAVPAFHGLITLYPTAEDLAKADEKVLAQQIRRLGLQNIRARRYIHLAQKWMEQPPAKGRRHRKLHYPKPGDGKDIKPRDILDDDDSRIGAWEIAHLPSTGPYAIDSWRIFCRDELRGLATGWNGEEAKAVNFEPEWKRVLPKDKELRAFLRWMWLKEGIAWDPSTGERVVASTEVLEKAYKGQSAYDDLPDMSSPDSNKIVDPSS